MDAFDNIVAIVTPKQPFYDWAKVLDADGGPQASEISPQEFTTAFLIDSVDELENAIEPYWDEVFREMLESWCAVPSLWPAGRSYEMFCIWFDVQIVDLVFDLA